jgi:hypothetical protein
MANANFNATPSLPEAMGLADPPKDSIALMDHVTPKMTADFNDFGH